ncbi:MAG: ATP-binding protein [Bacteroidota bacterium]
MLKISLKNKLFLGFGFLFTMIILIWTLGSYFIYNLSNRSSAMLSENYQTVESTRFLLQAVDEIKEQQLRYFFGERDLFDDTIYKASLAVFGEHLIAVKNNVTEEGEQVLTDQLEASYLHYKSTFERIRNSNVPGPDLFFLELLPEYHTTRNQIVNLWDMNMNAISRKNALLKSTAHRAFLYMSIIGTICFIISAFFLLRYPGRIAGPISELTRGITEIANRNYSKRLLFQSSDELGELAKAFNTMAAKLDEYEHSKLSELLFEKKRIDTIINNMNDAIIGLNEKMEVIFSNTNACRIFGSEAELLVGRYAPDLAVKNTVFQMVVSGLLDQPAKDMKDFTPLRMESEGKVRYYSREVLKVSLTKTGEDEPVRAGMVIVLKNITHFLEQDEAKTHFMATISHELKTPISSLRLNLKLLDDPRIGPLNEEQKEIVAALNSETNKMRVLTKELLDLAQLETGHIQFNLQPVPVAGILASIREAAENPGKIKNIQLEFSEEPDLPSLYADAEKTIWALINVVTNAIQYSEKGGKVSISVSKSDEEVVFQVKDQGKGIDSKYHELIFHKYYRVPGTMEAGTGLGLSITKEFINKQNGKIRVESAPGKGSSFFLSLPAYKTLNKQ